LASFKLKCEINQKIKLTKPAKETDRPTERQRDSERERVREIDRYIVNATDSCPAAKSKYNINKFRF